MIRSVECCGLEPILGTAKDHDGNTTFGEDANRVETSICGLVRRWRHNASAPIFKLPPEVLNLIFELIVNPDHLTQDPGRPHPYQQLNISHTCSRWRQLALGSTNLWTHITLNASQCWVETLLDRSQQAPLIVEVDLQCPHIRDFSPVWAQIPRIRRLSVMATSRFNFYDPAPQHLCVEAILPNIPVVAELLESFTLLASGYVVSAYLPESIFAAGTPRLRQLELQNCDFDINSPFLTGITSFMLTSKLEISSSQQIVDALGSMPNLEILYLEESIPSFHDTVHPPSQECIPIDKRKPLQQLTQLSVINARVADCLHILNYFTFPTLSTTKLVLEGTRDASELETLASTVSRLVNDEGLGTRRPFHHLDAWCNFSWRVELEAWNMKPTDASNESPPFCLWATLPGHRPADICNTLVGILPLEDLHVLRVHDFGVIDWSMFRRLRSLHCLSTSEFNSDAGLLQALSMENPLTPQLAMGVQKDQLSILYFPSLRELKVQGWDYNEERDMLLRSVLVKRKDSYIPIMKLTLILCDISSAQEQGLSEIVEEVVVEHQV
ncbi:hypothetical protein BDZ94DRAFT_232219 [Collybia nuda]|uniref:F-box domain-containing protein n=1 Tax=Collybia nuda TaxID=64659 RepID=A0A9P5XXD5_9AGAR|nr:hypothetical protein BDZ94DRAFT_232219 [Collybia nuda]